MKADVRKEALRLRNALSAEEIQSKSKCISQRILPYLNGSIGLYHAYGSEVNLLETLRYTKGANALPKTFPDHTIRFYAIDEHTSYTLGSYGIREPKDAREVKDLDVLFIPLVAFDERCNRLGHGAGYYDRYLAHFKGLKIGIAYECQKVDCVYEEDHDVALDIVITECRIYKNMNI